MAQPLRVVLYSLLVIVLPFGLYWYSHMHSREQYLTDRNQRYIRTASKQIATRLSGLSVAVSSAAKECCSDFNKGNCSHVQSVKGCPDGQAHPNCCYRHSSLSQAPVLKLTEFRPAHGEVPFRLPTNAGAMELFWRLEDAAPKVYLRLAFGDKDGEGLSAAKASEFCRSQDAICAAADIHHLLDPIFRLAPEFFDDIILVSGAGRMLYWSGAHKVQREDVQRALARVKGDTSSTPKAGEKTEERSSGDAGFIAFTQRVLLTATSPTSEKDPTPVPQSLVLVGFVNADRLQREELSISPVTLSIVLAIVVLALLSYPLLQLWCIGQRERLRRADVRRLVPALLLGAAVCTALLLDIAAYSDASRRIDLGLRSFSKDLETNLRSELRAIYEQLGKVVEQPNANTALTYPYLTQILYFDAAGKPEQAYRVTRTHNEWKFEKAIPPAVNVADRGYFVDAQRGGSWVAPSPTPGNADSQPRFGFEPVLSRASGEVLVVAAMQRGPSTPNGVVAITTRLSSLMNPVLPPGLRFAVIARDGKVLLHSDPTRDLQENFFEELPDSLGLEAAALNRHAAFFDLDYYGWPERVYIRPLAGTPWYLVAFYDRILLEMLHTKIAGAWVAIFLTYAIACGILVLIVRLAAPGHRMAWLWPNRQNPYLGAFAIASGVLAVAMITVIRTPDPVASLAIVIAAPWLAGGGVYLEMRRRDTVPWWVRVTVALGTMLAGTLVFAAAYGTRQTRVVGIIATLVAIVWLVSNRMKIQGERVFRFLYVGMLFSFLVLWSVLPAAEFYTDARDQAVAALARYELVNWAIRLNDRVGSVREQLDSQLHDNPAELAPWQDRLKVSYDVYKVPPELRWLPPSSVSALPGWRPVAAFARDRFCSGLGDGTCGRWLHILRRHFSGYLFSNIPSYTRISSQIGQLIETRADDDEAWRWSENNSSVQFQASPKWAPAPLPATLPALDPWKKDGSEMGALILLLAPLAALIAFCVLWSVVRRVFLLDADAGQARRQPAVPSQSEYNNVPEAERRALMQLAVEGFLNPNNSDVARSLMQKGLIVRTPTLEVAPAVRNLLPAAEAPADEAALALEHRDLSTWSRTIRTPFLVLVLGTLVFLALTQPHLVSSSVALVATIGTTIATVSPHLTRILEMFRRGSDASKPTSTA